MANRALNRRGTVVPGALVIILIFILSLSCMAVVILEYSHFSRASKIADQQRAAKNAESLTVQLPPGQSAVDSITVSNIGSNPSLVVAVVAVNPVDNTPQFQWLSQPVSIGILGEQTVTLSPPISRNWKIGVLTSYGNIFWYSQSASPPSPSPFDFSVSVSPTSGSVQQGGSVTATVTVTLVSGSTQSVSLSASGLPSGATASFNPSSGNPTFTSTMTISTSSSTPTGTYTITITGTGGGLTRTTTYTLTVMRWLTGWQYRKSHVINPAAGAGTNYQVRITVHYGSGTDSGEHVYLNGHCRTDFGDVRFTDDDKTTLLDYWMETKVDSNYAVFWVEVADDLSTNPVTIYIYYGNSSATTTSSGQSTFLMFRDVAADLLAQFGTLSLKTYSNPSDPGDGFTTSSTIDGKYASPCLWFRYYGGKKHARTSDYLYFEGYLDGGNYGCCGTDVRYRSSAAPTGWQSSMSYVADTTINRKHIVVLDYFVTGTPGLNFYSTWAVDSDIPTGTAAASYTLTATSRTIQEFVYSGTIEHILLTSGTGNSLTLYHEFLAIAKYVSPEPSHGSWGSEEVAP